jgi:O-antigen/teichoic acid export membrane protein
MLSFLSNLNPDFKKLLSGSGLVMAFKVAGAGAGYVFAYLITSNYGARAFGIFELSLTALTIASVFGRLGLDGALVRFIPEFVEKKAPEHLRKVYGYALILALPFSMVLAALLYVFSDAIALQLGSELLGDAFRITAFLIPFSTWFGLNSEAFRGMRRMVEYSIFQRGTVILLAIIAFFSFQYFEIEIEDNLLPLIAFGIGAILLSLTAGIRTPRILSQIIPPAASNDKLIEPLEVKPLLRVAFPMLLSTSMFMIMNWTDTIMIGYYLDEKEVGIYRLAFKVASLITFAQFAINSIAAPMFSAFYAKNDLAGMKKIIRNIGYMNIAISTPIFIAILIFPSLVLDFFGEDFSAGAAPMIVLAIGQIINALCGPVMYLLNMTGKEKKARNIIIIASIINLGLNVYFIPIYGLMGAAFATAISTAVWNVMAVIQIKKEYGFISIPHPF